MTARDELAKAICKAAGPECDCGDGATACVFYRAANNLLVSPDAFRQELAALLNPWRRKCDITWDSDHNPLMPVACGCACKCCRFPLPAPPKEDKA